MPIIQITINLELNREKKENLFRALSDLSSGILGKPVSDIMLIYNYQELFMTYTFDPALFIDFRLISGFNVEIAKELCSGIKELFKKTCLIDSSRMYINFFEVEKRHAWRFINENPVCPSCETQ